MMKKHMKNVVWAIVLLTLVCSSSAEQLRQQPGSENPFCEAIVVANNQFALDLYGRLADDQSVKKQGGNLFFSPYSISTALAMTCAGARDQTQEQMERVLHFYYPLQRIHCATPRQTLYEALGLLQNQLNKDKDAGYELNVANALWGQKGYGFVESFLELNKRYFGAGFNEVDFAQSEKARKTINTWVEKKTKDKIKELIRQGVLNPLTTLVLTNAIYFKGDWSSKFKEMDTKDAVFHITEDKTVEVSMMYQKGKFAYSEGEEAQTLVLPYKGDELSMLIVLPKKIGLLASVESDLTSKNLKFEQGWLREQEVRVYLPKFKITCGVLELKHILRDMGMKDAFSLPPADFSGMTGSKELFISAVLHKAFVEVNEEGTEAAAATAVIMDRTSLPMPTPVFRADHPFVFMIKDNRSGSILFMGRVVNPAKQVE